MTTRLEEGKIRVFHVRASAEKIMDEGLMKKLLMTTVRRIGMTPHGRPKIVRYPVPELGTTGFAILGYQTLHGLGKDKRKLYAQELEESYVVADTWPEQGYMNLLVNSCKPYDDRRVVEVLREFLDPEMIWLGMEERYSAQPKPGQKVVWRREDASS